MSRAALLPHPADPFMLKYWLKFYNDVWKDEVDKLYVLVNSPIEPEVAAYMKSMLMAQDKCDWAFLPNQIEHGHAIDYLLDMCQEDYVMLIEDDGFIFKKGYVSRHFRDVESGDYDLIGSPRGSCSQEISDKAKEIWDLDYSGYGDVGCNFWPNFLFTKKEYLLATDRNFCAKFWKQGETIKPLHHVVSTPDGVAGDTLVSTSLQLRAMLEKARILTIPQYHGSPDDLRDYERMMNLWDGKSYWTHVGSLSSGTHGVLIDDEGRSLARRKIDPPKDNKKIPSHCNSESEKKEWERRVQWWLTFLEYYEQTEITDPISEFKQEYRKAIHRIITQYSLSEVSIRSRQMIYKKLGL